MTISRQTRMRTFFSCSRPGYLLSDIGSVFHSQSSPQPTPKINIPVTPESTCGTLQSRIEGALRWELVRLFDSGQSKTEAILSYLASAEARELDVWVRDDIRIAWLTVLHAASGVADAWGYSFWQFFGKTYPKALLAWAERDEINRKALERCAAMVRAEKENHRNTSQTTTRLNESTRSLLQTGEGRPIPRKSLPDIRENEPRSIRIADGSREGASANPVPVANLYESARQFLALPPKKAAQSVKRKERAA